MIIRLHRHRGRLQEICSRGDVDGRRFGGPVDLINENNILPHCCASAVVTRFKFRSNTVLKLTLSLYIRLVSPLMEI